MAVFFLLKFLLVQVDQVFVLLVFWDTLAVMRVIAGIVVGGTVLDVVAWLAAPVADVPRV